MKNFNWVITLLRMVCIGSNSSQFNPELMQKAVS
jgi:hypothetical protein